MNHDLFGKELLQVKRLRSVLMIIWGLMFFLSVRVLQASGVKHGFRSVRKEEVEMDFPECSDALSRRPLRFSLRIRDLNCRRNETTFESERSTHDGLPMGVGELESPLLAPCFALIFCLRGTQR